MRDRGVALLVVALLSGCRGSESGATDEDPASDSASAEAEESRNLRQLELPAVPEVPPAMSGRFAARTSANDKPEYLVAGDWDAHAVHCDTAGLLQVYADGPTFDAVLLIPADSVAGPDTLDLSNEDAGVLATGTARLGVQHLQDDRGYSFQGARGQVTVSSYSPVTARITGYIYETTYRDTIAIAGVFHRIPVAPTGGPECQFRE